MTRFLMAAAAAALMAPAAVAQVPQQGGVLGQLLGSLFGGQQASEQEFEQDWNQGRRPFAQRQAALEARIDAALRDGSLNRYEADQVRREYYDIVRLEAQYSANGSYTQEQRRELRQRYRALTQRVGGGQDGNGQWQPVAGRNAEFEARLGEAVRNRRLSQADAVRVRAEWRYLVQVESSYRSNGIDAREQADLWRRFNDIDARLGGTLGGGTGGGYGGTDWRQLEQRLMEAERAGRISRVEAGHVRAQIGDLTRLEAAYGNQGGSGRDYLVQRYRQLEQMVGYRR